MSELEHLTQQDLKKLGEMHEHGANAHSRHQFTTSPSQCTDCGNDLNENGSCGFCERYDRVMSDK